MAYLLESRQAPFCRLVKGRSKEVVSKFAAQARKAAEISRFWLVVVVVGQGFTYLPQGSKGQRR